jgi:predicted murein hydrolase (TIGR00659 family)
MEELGVALAGFVKSPVFGVVVTLAGYEFGCAVQRRCGGSPLANPVLIAIVVIVAGLMSLGIPYETFMNGGGLLRFLLGPATVALALPIHINAARIRGAAPGILAGVAAGAAVACASAVGIVWLFGGNPELLRSIAPKSVTTPIAIGISEQLGGHTSLTAVFVVTSGIIGAMLSGRLYDWIGVRDWDVRGLATGVAAHGIGTAQMLAVNETAGAFAGLAIGVTGLLTAVVLPLVAGWL